MGKHGGWLGGDQFRSVCARLRRIAIHIYLNRIFFNLIAHINVHKL